MLAGVRAKIIVVMVLAHRSSYCALAGEVVGMMIRRIISRIAIRLVLIVVLVLRLKREEEEEEVVVVGVVFHLGFGDDEVIRYCLRLLA